MTSGLRTSSLSVIRSPFRPPEFLSPNYTSVSIYRCPESFYFSFVNGTQAFLWPAKPPPPPPPPAHLSFTVNILSGCFLQMAVCFTATAEVNRDGSMRWTGSLPWDMRSQWGPVIDEVCEGSVRARVQSNFMAYITVDDAWALLWTCFMFCRPRSVALFALVSV